MKSLSNLHSNWILAKSTTQRLSIKGECTFYFSNFLITGLCNSSADSMFSETMPQLIPVPFLY